MFCYSNVPNKHVCTFISGKVCLLGTNFYSTIVLQKQSKTETEEKTPDKNGENFRGEEKNQGKENFVEIPKMGPQIHVDVHGLHHLNTTHAK